MAPNATPCVGLGGTPTPCGGDEDDAAGAGAGEEDGGAGAGEEDGGVGDAEGKVGGGGGENEEAGEAGSVGENAVFIPRRLPPPPFPPLPRRPELRLGSMALDLAARAGWGRRTRHAREGDWRAGKEEEEIAREARGIARAAGESGGKDRIFARGARDR